MTDPSGKPLSPPSAKDDPDALTTLRVKILLSVACLGVLVVHFAWKELDAVALGILALGLLPWLSAFLDVAELPGGVKVQFAKVKREQERQAKELAWIKLLVELVVSHYERAHLRNLAAVGPFLANVKKGSTFEWELRHLISLGLVERQPQKGVRSLFEQEGRRDVKEHLLISKRGIDYLSVFDEASV
jgi:hypothetical protein